MNENIYDTIIVGSGGGGSAFFGKNIVLAAGAMTSPRLRRFN